MERNEIPVGRMLALRLALLLTGAVALLALVGAAYQAIANKSDAHRSPEPGRLVDVGGFRLQLNCTGKGTPTVILESGLGDVLPEWERVQPRIAAFTRVCSYDRAGYGASDAGPMPRTSLEEADELHRLLKNAGERSPVVLSATRSAAITFGCSTGSIRMKLPESCW